MGDIIVDMSNSVIPLKVFLERKIDSIETQHLQIAFNGDAWLRTETGDSLGIFGRDRNGNTIEIEIPISVKELIKALDKQSRS